MATLDYGEFQPHPAADIFPLMGDDELNDLALDIQVHGQLDDIEILADTNLIVDGRNRWLACQLADVEPRFTEVSLDQMPFGVYEYVVAKNLHRRQLTADQVAMIAAEALPHLEAEAQERMMRGKADPNQDSDGGRSTEVAAKRFKTTRYKVEQAAQIQKADPELAAEVKQGKTTLREAEKQAGRGTAVRPKLPTNEYLLKLASGEKKTVTLAVDTTDFYCPRCRKSVTHKPAANGSSKKSSEPSEAALCRAWAKANNIEVNARGRVNPDVMAKYREANHG